MVPSHQSWRATKKLPHYSVCCKVLLIVWWLHLSVSWQSLVWSSTPSSASHHQLVFLFTIGLEQCVALKFEQIPHSKYWIYETICLIVMKSTVHIMKSLPVLEKEFGFTYTHTHTNIYICHKYIATYFLALLNFCTFRILSWLFVHISFHRASFTIKVWSLPRFFCWWECQLSKKRP